MALPAAPYHCSLRGSQLISQPSANNSPFTAAEDRACRDTSAALITRTWERPGSSGPSGSFSPLAAWESHPPADSTGEVLSSVVSQGGITEQLRT